jgi:hypothetical protein
VKKILIFIITSLLISSFVLCITIDGKFWDWGKIDTFYKCPQHILKKDRSGIDMENIKMYLGKKCLYMYIDGSSVAGLKPDAGWGAKKTSVRISFKSSQSPLNRVRIAAEPSKPGQIKISYPPAPSKVFGSKTDKYWAIAKYGKKYAFEIKIPFFITSKGIHVGVKGGPLLRISNNAGASRKNLSDVLINTVDVKTHRLVDTVEFSIKKGDL